MGICSGIVRSKMGVLADVAMFRRRSDLGSKRTRQPRLASPAHSVDYPHAASNTANIVFVPDPPSCCASGTFPLYHMRWYSTPASVHPSFSNTFFASLFAPNTSAIRLPVEAVIDGCRITSCSRCAATALDGAKSGPTRWPSAQPRTSTKPDKPSFEVEE